MDNSKLIETTHRVFPQSTNNKYAEAEWVKRLIDLLVALPVTEYAALRAHVKGEPYGDSPIVPTEHRLLLLAERLEHEGLYVDAGICFDAFEKLVVR